MAGFRFDLPHTHCAGYDAPRPGGGSVSYQADPKRPGTVVITDPRDARMAALALGQKAHSEGSIVHLSSYSSQSAGSWECQGCMRANWSWVETCPHCGVNRDDGRAA